MLSEVVIKFIVNNYKLLCIVLSFLCGMYVSSAHYKSVMIRSEVIVKASLLKQEQEYKERLVEAINEYSKNAEELENSRNTIARLNADIKRLHNSKNNTTGTNSSGTNANIAERLDRCEKLLVDGTDLVESSAKILSRVTVKGKFLTDIK